MPPLNSVSVGSSYFSPSAWKMPFQVSSVSASTVATNCFISSLAGGLVSADRAAAAGEVPGPPPPSSICSGSMPQARSPKNRTTRMMMPS